MKNLKIFILVLVSILFSVLFPQTQASIITQSMEKEFGFIGNSTIHLVPERTFGSVEETVFPEEFWQLNPPPPIPNKNIRIDTVYMAVSKGLEFTGAKAGDPWWNVQVINITSDKSQIALRVTGSWNPKLQPVENWYCNSSVLFIEYKTTGKKECFMTFYINGNWVMGYGINIAEDAALWQPSEVKLAPQPYQEYAIKKLGKLSSTWGKIKGAQ